MVKYSVVLVASLLLAVSAKAQMEQKPFTITGYGEVYYGFDFNQPSNNTRPGFVYSHNRHNEVNINLAMLHAAYQEGRVRGNIGVMMGTYANANLAMEPGVLRNIYEANAGFKVLKKRDLWIDAGVMPSHIGPEGAISMDCPTLTRSLIAEGSPYYESGVRLSYTSLNQKWYIAGLHLNGWQRIQRPNGNSTPAGGLQVTYTPSKRVLVNLSTFVGSDAPDSVDNMRYFVDLYTIVKFAKRFELTATIDLGNENYQLTPTFGNLNSLWLASALVLKCNINNRSAIVMRGEYVDDADNIIFASDLTFGTPFRIFGGSLGYDRYITKNLLWRIEGKTYQNVEGNSTFVREGLPVTDNYLVTTSLAVRFTSNKNFAGKK